MNNTQKRFKKNNNVTDRAFGKSLIIILFCKGRNEDRIETTYPMPTSRCHSQHVTPNLYHVKPVLMQALGCPTQVVARFYCFEIRFPLMCSLSTYWYLFLFSWWYHSWKKWYVSFKYFLIIGLFDNYNTIIIYPQRHSSSKIPQLPWAKVWFTCLLVPHLRQKTLLGCCLI